MIVLVFFHYLTVKTGNATANVLTPLVSQSVAELLNSALSVIIQLSKT